MAKIRNKSKQDLVVPGANPRLVVADGVAEVPDSALYGYTCQSIWEPVDKPSHALHDKGVKDERARVGAVEDEPEPDA